MAPRSRLLGIKALGYVIGTGSTSGILDAMHMAVDRGTDIISLSLGGPSKADQPEDDPYYEPMKSMIEDGVTPVIAAGNSGPDTNTIGTPGAIPDVLTVGALNQFTGNVAEFSSRGPTNWGSTKPDVLAPGFSIDSGLTGSLDRTDGMASGYSSLSGTSMATPHVSGLVSLMEQSFRERLGKNLSIKEIKRMMSSLGHSKRNDSGYGLITWDKWEKWMDTEYGARL